MNKKILKWFIGGGASNNSYVQSALTKGSQLGYTVPSGATLNALNTLFDSIGSTLLAKAESIKIYGLNDTNLENFASLNYINPSSNQSTLIGVPTYSTRGYRSTGAGVAVNENINANRRAGIEDNFSFLADVYSADTADEANASIFGSTTKTGSEFILFRPKTAGTLAFFAYSASTGGAANTVKKAFYSLSSNAGTALKTRYGKDGTYADGIISVVAPSNAYSIYSCAWNFNNSVLNPMTTADVGFLWIGYELTDAEINTVRTSVNTFKTAIGI